MERTRTLAEQIVDAADRPGPDLAAPAFLVARARVPAPRSRAVSRSPRSDGVDAALTGSPATPGLDAPLAARVDALNQYLFSELGFSGNREQYDDPRNSCLNEVLERRTGIPITLALVYIEVARRAGLRVGRHQLPWSLPGPRAAGRHDRRPGRGADHRPVPRRRASSSEADCRGAAAASTSARTPRSPIAAGAAPRAGRSWSGCC